MNHNKPKKTHPSLSFCRLAINLVKAVKQVSVKWVFPGGRLIRWKVIANSILHLKLENAVLKRTTLVNMICWTAKVETLRTNF